MKCLCDQGLDNRVKTLCEHHKRRFDADMDILLSDLTELRMENKRLNDELSDARGFVPPKKRKRV